MLCLVAQSCPTLCDLRDCNPPGYSVHGFSPGKNPRVSCHALLHGIFPTQELNPVQFGWGQTMVGAVMIMVTSFKRTYVIMSHGSQDCCIQCPWSCGRPLCTQVKLEIPGHSQANLAQSLGGITAPFSWVLVTQGFDSASKGMFLPSCGSSVIKSHWPSENSGGSHSLCQIPSLGNLL